ncbi:C40 family peptidase [Hymenobacter amundsenii]|uniref:C40 family peptidase n=1 Tax=Hymenobacter amundsenii TaxID=2006685 RepID=UPI0013FE3900|nr:C40 family peptidase [Hymenobacter amundsenii]
MSTAAPISVETAPAAAVAPAELRRLPVLQPVAPGPVAKADSIVAFALRQLGTNYCYAGITPEGGFDCSGFVLYVFARYGVATPHSTALLIDVGRPVARTEARPGDIVVFTGTAATSTTPGHAGIVISRPGEPIRFVHASSARRESGVKISQVEGTGYERRFMQVRRML